MEDSVRNRYGVVVILDKDAGEALLVSFTDHDEEIWVEAPGAVVETIEVGTPAKAVA